MKKVTLVLCCVLFAFNTIKAQKQSNSSIEELQKKITMVGNQSGKVTDYFTNEEIQTLQKYYSKKNPVTHTSTFFGPPVIAYAVENISFMMGSFDPMDASVFDRLGPSAPVGNNFEGAGAVNNNNPGTAYVIDSVGELYSVAVASGTYTYIGNIGVSDMNGLEFNPVDDVLYGVTATELYSIDLAGNSAILIGTLGTSDLAIALAIDGDGNAYTYDVNDDLLYSVNLTTGAATSIGSIGFDANFGQGMAWDVNTDQIYMTAFNNGLFDSQLRLVNTVTGGSTALTQMEPGTLTQYAWVALPFSPIVCDNTVYDSTEVPFDIDGADTSTADCTNAPNEIRITITDFGTIGETATFENVTIDITHEFSEDLDIYLVSPSGTEIALAEDLGGSTVNAYNGTVFEDGGADISTATAPFGTGPYAPVGGIFGNAFDGERITGDWILKVCDDTTGNTGQVVQFSISICTPPSNDNCEFAPAIFCGDSINGETASDTDSGGNPAPDEFFSYRGNGLPEEITISLCGGGTDFDSVLRVYDSCDLLNEITSDDNFCGEQSQVSFRSDGTTTYLIMVEGAGNESGNFNLNVSCVELVINDECEFALPITCGETLTGSTVGANVDIAPECGGLPITDPGVWYKFVDESGFISDYTISLCGSDFDTKLTVYTGECGNLVCEASNDDFCGAQSEVSFQGDGNTTYYILIHAFGGEVGNYSLSVNCVPVPQPNDECEFAIALACGDTFSGETISDTDSGGNEAPDEFFSYTGNGTEELITVSLCGSGTVYDSVLRIFDDCDLLNEIAWDDDFCGAQSQVSFTSDGVSTYLIMVEGFSSESGFFTLNLSCTAPILNDECVGALPIECGETITGSTLGANTDSGTPECGNFPISAPGVWYKLTDTSGLETDYTLSLCGSEFDTKLSIYTGECGDLVCEVGNDDFCGAQSEVSFQGDGSTTYYILVHGFAGEVGNFSLNAECVPVLGVQEEAIPGFSYYPNPTTGILNLKCVAAIEEVTVYNLLGQSVLEVNKTNTISQVDISRLSAGSYLMKVRVNGQTGIYKILKN